MNFMLSESQFNKTSSLLNLENISESLSTHFEEGNSKKNYFDQTLKDNKNDINILKEPSEFGDWIENKSKLIDYYENFYE